MDKITRNHGFTLVELIIIIMLVAIVGVFVVIRMPNQGAMDLPNQASQVTNNIRYTQASAMSANMRYRFYFGANNYSVAIFNQTTGSETFIIFPIANSTTVALVAGASFSKPPTPDCFAFNGKGQPCDCVSGALITTDITVSLTMSGLTRDIIITAYTGYIS